LTFKDLQKAIESQPDYTTLQQSEMLKRLRGKPFWIKTEHSEGTAALLTLLVGQERTGTEIENPFGIIKRYCTGLCSDLDISQQLRF
jgi:hypothetical protein